MCRALVSVDLLLCVLSHAHIRPSFPLPVSSNDGEMFLLF